MSVLSPNGQPIIDNPAALLQGEHTRSIVKKTPSARAGGIMMFAVKKLKVDPRLRALGTRYNSIYSPVHVDNVPLVLVICAL